MSGLTQEYPTHLKPAVLSRSCLLGNQRPWKQESDQEATIRCSVVHFQFSILCFKRHVASPSRIVASSLPPWKHCYLFWIPRDAQSTQWAGPHFRSFRSRSNFGHERTQTKTTPQITIQKPTPRGEGNVSVVPISEATLSSAVRTGARKTSTPLSPKPRASGLDNSTFSMNGRMEIINAQKIVWKMLVNCWSNIFLEIIVNKNYVNVQSEVRTTPEPSKSKQSLRQPQASTKENYSKVTTNLQNQFGPVAIPSSQILCIQGNNPTWHFNPSALDTFSLSRKTSDIIHSTCSIRIGTECSVPTGF